ncbi:hypothetical protein C8T65DRAFT_764007 [Cerioporus squamosus]|nr:hypothetical protein C8T65DRAFT_764007 [Cerioporus squamosus]
MYQRLNDHMRPPGTGRGYVLQAPSSSRLYPVHDTVRRGRRVTLDNFPRELLIKVFANVDATRPDGNWSSTRRLLPVMATCRQWRDLICGVPSFWSTIVVRRRPEWLTISLQRSQRVLIEVEFRSSTTNLSHAWHVLRQHKDRIASLYFSSLDCAQIGDRVALEEMRQLKSLRIFVDHDHDADATMHNGICPPLLLTFPRLERLHLDGLTVRGSSSVAVSALRELVIEGHPVVSKTIGLTHFLGILQACASLEILNLRDSALDTIAFDIPQNLPIVALRRLRELRIHGKVEEVSNLVSHLEVGPEVNILLATDEEVDPGRAAIAARNILPVDLQRCRLPILKTATRLKVHLCADVAEEILLITGTIGLNPGALITISLRIPEVQFDTRVGSGSDAAMASYYRNALRILPSIFSGAPVETLVCDGEVEVVHEDIWRSLFASFPMLRTLVVDDVAWGDVRPVFRALASQQSPADPRPVCRHLEYIWVRDALGGLDRLEDIRKCIAWRAACRLPLRRLRLELTADHGNAAPVPEVSGYRAEFARLVANSTLVIWDIMTEHGQDLRWQSNTEREHPFGDL